MSKSGRESFYEEDFKFSDRKHQNIKSESASSRQREKSKAQALKAKRQQKNKFKNF